MQGRRLEGREDGEVGKKPGTGGKKEGRLKGRSFSKGWGGRQDESRLGRKVRQSALA
jgi:hypothetical protein